MEKGILVSYSKRYETWVTPIQEEFVFEYVRPETPKEYERRVQSCEEEHDERFD